MVEVRKDPQTKRLHVDCINYAPCPICDRCDRAGMYHKCEGCPVARKNNKSSIGRCDHDHYVRSAIIRRENFAIKVNDPVIVQAFEDADRRAQQIIASRKISDQVSS